MDDGRRLIDEHEVATYALDVAFEVAQATIAPLVDGDIVKTVVLPETLTPDLNNVIILPEGISLADFAFEIDGIDLLMVGADGAIIRIIGGALSVPTFEIGDLELPQETIALALGESDIDIAADGAAVPSRPDGSGSDFEDAEAGLGEVEDNNELLGDTSGDEEEISASEIQPTDFAPEASQFVIIVTFDDDATLASGNEGGDGDVADATTFTGPAGALFTTQDPFDRFEFDLATIEALGVQAVYNNGNVPEIEDIDYSQTDTIVEENGESVTITTLTATGVTSGNIIFEIAVKSDGSFTFEIFQPLAHDTPGVVEETLNITVPFTIFDTDGDSDSGSLAFSVNDDTPTGGENEAVPLDDDNVPEDTSSASQQVGGQLNFSAGADGAIVAWDETTFTTSSEATAQTDSSQNNAVTEVASPPAISFAVVDGLLSVFQNQTGSDTTATSADQLTLIFTIDLNTGTGAYEVMHYNNLLHLDGEGENDQSFSFGYVVTDGDGDPITGTLDLTLNDDIVEIGTPVDTVVDEEGLTGGNAGDSYRSGDAAGSDIFVSGSLEINWGADDEDDSSDDLLGNDVTAYTQDTPSGVGDRSVTFASPNVSAVSAVNGSNLSALSSGGETIEYILSDDGTVLLGYINGSDQTIFSDLITGSSDPNNDFATNIQKIVSSDVVFVVILSDDNAGSYSFALLAPLDHPTANVEDDIALTFDFVATDSDGDSATSRFTATVNDDAPVFGGNVGTPTVDEEGLSGGNAGDSYEGIWGDYGYSDFDAGGENDYRTSVTQSLNINWGADDENSSVDGSASTGYGDRALTFTDTDVRVFSDTTDILSTENNYAFTSRGEDVLIRYGADTNGDTNYSILEGYVAGSDPSSDRIVFTVSLSDNDNSDGTSGSYTFELADVLDHIAPYSAEDNLKLTFNVTATDSDGDSATSSFTVIVDDDAPVQGIAGTAAVLGEDGLTGANLSGGSFEASDQTTVSAVSLGIEWGADDDTRGTGDAVGRTVAFSDASGALATTTTSSLDASDFGLSISNGSLSSGGVALVYAVSATDAGGQILTAYAGSVADGNEVFRITLDPTSTNGSYTFELLGALDHAATSNSLEISFSYAATDADGDQGSVGTASVTVQDDVPIAYQANSGIGYDEATITDGNANNNVMNGQIRFQPGADGAIVSAVSLSTDNWGNGSKFALMASPNFANASLELVTVGGLHVIVVDNGNDLATDGSVTLTGYLNIVGTTSSADVVAPGSEVFALTVNSDGSYSYEQFMAFDHPVSGSIESADQLLIEFEFTVTDGDGDTSTNHAFITVADDGPTISTAETVTVTEESLVDQSGDPTTVNADGSLAISWGADDGAARSVVFSDTQDGLSGLTSFGETVNVAQLDDGTLVGYTGSTKPTATSGSQVVFYASLDATIASTSNGDGSYSFTLVKPLDHPDANLTTNEQYIDLTFSYVATDSDGDDSAASTFTVRVDAAGDISSIDYSNLITGVYVNLYHESTSDDFGSMAADTATDASGGSAVVGVDSMVGIVNATGGSGDDILIGGDEANLLNGGAGDDGIFGIDGNDVIAGGAGDDLIFGGAGSDMIRGQDGDDGILGGEGVDTLYGGDGNDTIYGGDDNDYIEGGLGDDTLYGGAGDDTVSYKYAAAGVTIDLSQQGSAQDTIGAGSDTLSGFENVTGSSYDDTITGSSEANHINASLGDDVVVAGAGADYVNGGSGDDIIDGGAGNDTLLGGFGNDTVSYATASSAVTVDLRQQGSAQDTRGAGIDALLNFENLTGSEFGDTLTGDDGDNVITGLAGDDIIEGGLGEDTLDGGDGDDTIDGGAGDDIIYSSIGENNRLDGGEGTDTVSYQYDDAGVFAVLSSSITTYQSDYGEGVYTGYSRGLYQGYGTGQFDRLVNFENLTGSDYGDTLLGSDEGNVINGLAGEDIIGGKDGDDIIDGGTGNDRLFGEGGNDFLYGGEGADYLEGGEGADTFFIDTSAYSETNMVDVIADYDYAQDDVIDLSDLLQNAFGAVQADASNVSLDTNGSSRNVVVDGQTVVELQTAVNTIKVLYADGEAAVDVSVV